MFLKAVRRFALLVFLPVIVSVQLPAWADEVDARFEDARNSYQKAIEGDKRSVRTAIKRFKALSYDHPDRPVYVVYHGASIILKGRDAPSGINKQRFAEEGVQVIDQALAKLADKKDISSFSRLEAMLVAANTFVYMPKSFNRYDKGKELLDEILADADFNAMDAGFRAAAFFTAALFARGDGDENESRRYLKLTVDTDPVGRNGRAASKMLEDME